MARYKWKPEFGWFVLFAVSTIGFSLVQDSIRPEYTGDNSTVRYLLGVLPNFFPGVGLPALFMIVIPEVARKGAVPAWIDKKMHITAMIIAAGGLMTWEFVQIYTSNGVFDRHDLLWTLMGTGCFYLFATLSGKLSKEVIEHSQGQCPG